MTGNSTYFLPAWEMRNERWEMRNERWEWSLFLITLWTHCHSALSIRNSALNSNFPSHQKYVRNYFHHPRYILISYFLYFASSFTCSFYLFVLPFRFTFSFPCFTQQAPVTSVSYVIKWSGCQECNIKFTRIGHSLSRIL